MSLDLCCNLSYVIACCLKLVRHLLCWLGCLVIEEDRGVHTPHRLDESVHLINYLLCTRKSAHDHFSFFCPVVGVLAMTPALAISIRSA